ncbi:hypothetical protein GCM10022221_60270 [Actinocorallia aurea]
MFSAALLSAAPASARITAAALLALPLGFALPAEASARRVAEIEAIAVTPEEPVLYDTRTTTLTARIRTTGASSLTVTFNPEDAMREKVDAVRLSTSGGVQQWEASITLDRGRKTGLWDIRVNAWDGVAGTTVRSTQVYVRRETRFTRFDAGPEPVRHGRRLRLDGRVTRLDPLLTAPEGMVRYAGARVRLYFSSGVQEPRTWRHVADATTDSLGRFSRVVYARKTGYWRAGLTGTPDYAPAYSWPDHVRMAR